MQIEDIIIIGSGPAGLAAAIYNSRADLSPLVISGVPYGGQLMLTTHVENYPGFPSIPGPELIEKMREHAKGFGTRFVDQNVESVDFRERPLKLILSNKQEVLGQAVLIATGASAVWLGLKSEQRFKNRGVSACATCDGALFREKTVAVVGGGDTAMEDAQFLTKFASKVFIIHRRDQFRASKILQKRVFANKKIEIIFNAEIVEVVGKDRVEGIKLKRSEYARSGSATPPAEIRVDGLFVAIGHKPNTEFLKGSGVEVYDKGYVYTGEKVAWENCKLAQKKDVSAYSPEFRYQTCVAGVFAAGDVADPTYRQATTAVGMGVAAALEVEKYLETLPKL